MIHFFSFPSVYKNGAAISLAEILDCFPENDLVWSILDFHGIGFAPNELTMDSFDELIKSNSNGFLMKWTEIKRFSCSIEQIFDCLIVAGRSALEFSGDRSSKDNFINCDVVIELFDSTEWSILVHDSEVRRKILISFSKERLGSSS